MSPTVIIGLLGIVLSLPAWFFFIRAVRQAARLITQGQPTPHRMNKPVQRFIQLFKKVFFHTELMKKPLVASAHWFVMMGFLIGSLVWFEAYIQTFNPAGGWPLLSDFSLYHFAEEIFALGTVLGILFLIFVRLRKPARFQGSNARAAVFVESVILLEGLGMLLVKAAKIATYGHSSAWADFASRHVATFLHSSPILVSSLALFKLLVGMVWLTVVAGNLNWGVAWHRFLAFFSIFFGRHADGTKALGALPPMFSDGAPLTLENVEDDSQLGVGTLQDANWKMLLDTTTCTECGRCQDQCPAWNTQKPLSPKLLMMGLRDTAIEAHGHEGLDVLKLVGETDPVHPDVLWSCTNCGACVEQCPVDIEHIDHIANLRRFQVLAESDFPSELSGMFKNLEVKGNPWGRNNSERQTWIDEARRDGIDVPILGEDETDFEYLFWVGCAGTFDDAGKKTTRAVVELLHTAGVHFAVLAKGETCTGDPARRAGNEFLFQQLAMENIATLNDAFTGVPRGRRKIITTCAHCFNTIRNEYPDFDGHYDVFHHTQLLNRLVREKLLTPVPRGPKNRKPITYHDPCFLGRHNKIFDPPRELITATGATLEEMPRNRNEGFCCGAGGARMFMEEKLGTRINENRAAEAAATGATEVAVGCPFCNTMLTSGLKATAPDDAPAVKDVAQMLRDSILIDGHLPTPRTKQPLELPIRSVKQPQSAHPNASTPTTSPTPMTNTGTGSSTSVGSPAPSPAIPPAGIPAATSPLAAPGSAVPPSVATPPLAVPPVAGPPASAPPATPPVAVPPVATPPSVAPSEKSEPVLPAPTPPGITPPAQPPTAQPPTIQPPAAAPPTATPPAAVPQATAPAVQPPVATPPLAVPPVSEPPASAPVATPPVAVPPVATPPSVAPSEKSEPVLPAPTPPGITPPTQPPTAQPPTIQPPAATPPPPPTE